MEAAEAISLATEFILWKGLDYPTDELVADRFEAGWSVYAPVDVDESDPMAFLDMPVGRSCSWWATPGASRRCRLRFRRSRPKRSSPRRSVPHGKPIASPTSWRTWPISSGSSARPRTESPSPNGSFTAVDGLPEEGALDLGGDEETAEEASLLIDSIVHQLGQLGPPGWERFSAEFAFTVSSQIAQLRFQSDDRTVLLQVPQSIADMVRRQREITAELPTGPWWRLLLTATNDGDATVNYDYGDEPFPDDQLVAREHYLNDLGPTRARTCRYGSPDTLGDRRFRGGIRDRPRPRWPTTPLPGAPRSLPRMCLPFPTCGRVGRCCRLPMLVSDLVGAHGFTLATRGMRASIAAGPLCSRCPAIAR